jgi:hypothetical protein
MKIASEHMGKWGVFVRHLFPNQALHQAEPQPEVTECAGPTRLVFRVFRIDSNAIEFVTRFTGSDDSVHME